MRKLIELKNLILGLRRNKKNSPNPKIIYDTSVVQQDLKSPADIKKIIDSILEKDEEIYFVDANTMSEESEKIQIIGRLSSSKGLEVVEQKTSNLGSLGHRDKKKGFLDKIKKISLFLWPWIFIVCLLYLRLTVIKNIEILFIALSTSQIILTFLAIILLIWRIYLLLQKLDIIQQRKITNKLFLWFEERLGRISLLLTELWIAFIRLFTYHAKSVTINLGLLNLIKKIQIWQEDRFQPTLGLIIFFQVLPRVINLTAFLIDIFCFQEFFYFYKTIGLLLLPLIYSAIMSIIKLYHDDNIESARSCLIITKETKEPFFRYNYEFTEDFHCPPHIQGVKDFVLNHYFVFRKITYMFLFIEEVRNYFYIYWLLLGVSFGYLIGWLAILFFGLTF